MELDPIIATVTALMIKAAVDILKPLLQNVRDNGIINENSYTSAVRALALFAGVAGYAIADQAVTNGATWAIIVSGALTASTAAQTVNGVVNRVEQRPAVPIVADLHG